MTPERDIGPIGRYINQKADEYAASREAKLGKSAVLQQKLNNELALSKLKLKVDNAIMDPWARMQVNVVGPIQSRVQPYVSKAINALKPNKDRLEATRKAEGYPPLEPIDAGEL